MKCLVFRANKTKESDKTYCLSAVERSPRGEHENETSLSPRAIADHLLSLRDTQKRIFRTGRRPHREKRRARNLSGPPGRVEGGPEGRDHRVNPIRTGRADLVCCLCKRSSRTDSTFRDLSQRLFLSSASAVSSFQEIQRTDTANGEVTHTSRY